MRFPAAAETGVEQERTALPSMCTVQAPHRDIPQPYFVPVRPRRSRRTHRRGMSSGAVTSWSRPFTLRRTRGLLLLNRDKRTRPTQPPQPGALRCPPSMVIIGLSTILHESAVGVVAGGRLVAAAAEERFSRIKNDGGFPHRALAYVMGRAGITARDVDHVAYAALPFHRERLMDLSHFARNVVYVAGAPDPPRH